jgi:hypothetical protein
MRLFRPGLRIAVLPFAVAAALLHCTPATPSVAREQANVDQADGSVSVICDGAEKVASGYFVGRVARDAERLYWVQSTGDRRGLISSKLDGTDVHNYDYLFDWDSPSIEGIDDEWLYVLDLLSIKRVRKVPDADAAANIEWLYSYETASDHVGLARHMQVDGDQIYFLADDTGPTPRDAGALTPGVLAMIPKTGGTPTRLADGYVQAEGLTVTKDFVYVEEYFEKRHAVPKPMASTAPPSTSGLEPAFAFDDGYQYATRYPASNSTEGTIIRTPHGPDGTPTTLYSADSTLRPSAPYLDGDDLYFVLVPSFNPGEIVGKVARIPKSGGVMKDLVTGLDYPVRVFTDGDYVYWITIGLRSGPAGSDKRDPVASGLYRARKADLEVRPVACRALETTGGPDASADAGADGAANGSGTAPDVDPPDPTSDDASAKPRPAPTNAPAPRGPSRSGGATARNSSTIVAPSDTERVPENGCASVPARGRIGTSPIVLGALAALASLRRSRRRRPCLSESRAPDSCGRHA